MHMWRYVRVLCVCVIGVVVPASCHRHLLSELCGEYNIHVEVSTDVGQTAGLPITVVVGEGTQTLLPQNRT